VKRIDFRGCCDPAQLFSSCGRVEHMETAAWFDVAPNGGVLELHEELTARGPALELHLVIDPETDATIALWAMGDRGLWLGKAVIGDT
jgi:hypothetical protein